MQQIKGIAAGFVAGVAVAAGPILWLRAHDDAERTEEKARIVELNAQSQRLEQAVSRLSGLVAARAPVAAAPAGVSMSGAPPPTAVMLSETSGRDSAQVQEIAAADALVDRGIASGHWSQEQAIELSAAVAGMDLKERGRILARISAAINAGQLRVELP